MSSEYNGATDVSAWILIAHVFPHIQLSVFTYVSIHTMKRSMERCMFSQMYSYIHFSLMRKERNGKKANIHP